MDKISVITVVYNGERYLRKTIESVALQKYQNLEYIIIDGGSTDATMEIVRELSSSITKAVSEPDRGLAHAMNKGLNIATGDWVLFLHADDHFVNSDAITSIWEEIKNTSNLVWATGFLQFVDKDDIIFKQDKFRQINWTGMLLRNLIRHQATIVRLKEARDISFREKYRYAMDYDFFIRLWQKFGAPYVIRSYIANFRLDGNNLSSNFYASIKDEMAVRVDFRVANRERYLMPLDYLVYVLRVLKLKFIHKKC
ncbi:glycosyltransferase family 2 protein [Pelobium manganitolerans]|uniref:glycosyltransferase family 2 protein n=1 Tax=Pelobium manganitolerans TaxID=1842495 RepID=UPI003FA3AA4F